MRGQRFDVAVILTENGGELIALRQRQPHAGNTQIHQHGLCTIGAYTKINLDRRGTVAGHVGEHDKIIRCAFA